MPIKAATPQIGLRVNGTDLPKSVMQWCRSVEVTKTVDGADILEMSWDGWDARLGQFRNLDAKMLFAGNFVEVFAWYGTGQPVSQGRFKLKARQPEYSQQGVLFSQAGFDALDRLTTDTQARVFLDCVRDSDVVEQLAEQYGFEIDAEPTPRVIPVNAALSSPGRGRRNRRHPIKKTPFTSCDRVKPAGVSDLAYLKILAEGAGYAYPKVKWDSERQRDVLIFRPPCSDPNEYSQEFRYRKPGATSGDLIRFKPTFSTSDAPTGVEIMGWDPKTQRAYRAIATMTAAGPEVMWDEGQRVDEKVPVTVQSGAALQLSILGSGRAKVKMKKESLQTSHGLKRWNPEKEVRDTLATEFVSVHGTMSREELEAYAKMWLESRQSSWFTAEGELQDQPGLELVDTDQAHRFVGMCAQDEGWYILLEAKHSWVPGVSHKVAFKAQKLIEWPSQPIATRIEEATA